MKGFVSRAACLLLTCTVVGSVWARDLDVLYTFESANPANSGWFGFNCEGLGDVNNDGYEDIGVGATYEDPGGIENAGKAYVYSGETGDKLYSLTSPNAQAYGEFGCPIAGLGDVNGDGHDDFIVAAWLEMAGGLWGAGRVYVYSGATGDTLYSLESPDLEQGGRFGTWAGGHGDVDNDGYPDFAVGARAEDYAGVSDAGRLHVFSGATGDTIRTLGSPHPAADGRFGQIFANAGDVDADGTDDLVVGASGENIGGFLQAGMAYVFSGATGNLLWPLSPPDVQPQGWFGWGSGGAGDVNGDGHADVVVGACGLNIAEMNIGRAYVFSGATGDTLYALDSPHPNQNGSFGWSVWGGEDYDGDSGPDLVVGAYGENGPGGLVSGKAYMFSGATGELILPELSSAMPEDGGQFGYWVGGADANGDARKEVIIAAPTEDGGTTDAGRVYVFSQVLLEGSLSGGALVLNWSYWSPATAYWVYGADNEAFFEPGLTSPYQHRLAVLPVTTTTWSSSSGVGDAAHNWTYSVLAVDATEQELCRSNRVGEHDYALTIGQ